MHVRRYSYFEGSMHLHLLPILGMGGRGPLEKRASPFLGKGRHLRTVPNNVCLFQPLILTGAAIISPSYSAVQLYIPL